jgi:CubicO group peptidase (beta-lactamase class C family)
MKYLLSLFITFFSCANSNDVNEDIQKSVFTWEEASPSEVGLSENLIDELSIEASSLPNIYSFIVVKNGKLISENYYHGKSKKSLLHIRSITKSVSSILFGIALKEEQIPNTDIKLKDYFPSYINESSDARLNELSVQHILDMQSGFNWNENNEAINWYTQITNPLEYLFSKGIVDTPGDKFNYNSAAVSLLAHVLNKESGVSYSDFANETLFQKIGIANYHWDKDAQGIIRSDAGLALRARDCAKIGYLYLQNGMFNDEVIVTSEWVNKSWNPKIDLNGNYGPIENLHYSNLWWNGTYNGKSVFFGLGYGGQLLLCVPEDELIVVTNHEFQLNPTQAATHSSTFLNTIFKKLMDSL